MLLTSQRHTIVDREEWAKCERVDAINAKRWAAKLAEKSERAASHIREFLLDGPAYAGCSWGKDSLVLAHIIASYSINVPVVWVRVDGVENPDCPLVRDAFLSCWPINYHEVTAPVGERRTSAAGFELAASRFGDRHISGVRGDEAHYRALRMRRFGVSTDRTCAPLGWWSIDEIFAYAYAHTLPLHPAYGCLGGGLWARGHRRVGAIGGQRGTGWGRGDWERQYYPESFRAKKP